MSNFYLGEIRLLANNYAPRYWSQCMGQLISVPQNTSLFALLGTAFGGNGRTTFGLPNLIGRVPLGFGTGPGLPSFNWGELDGEAEHSLTTSEMPMHTHAAFTRFTADLANVTDVPTNQFLSRPGVPSQAWLFLKTPPGDGQSKMAEEILGTAGATEAHENRQPFLCINYYIAMDGIWPPRS